MFSVTNSGHSRLVEAATQLMDVADRQASFRRSWKKSYVAGSGGHTPIKPTTWVAVVSCEDCGEERITSSSRSRITGFECELCSGPCSISFVAGSRRYAEKAYETAMRHHEKREQARDDRKLDDPVETMARRGHKNFVARFGCSVQGNGDYCPWCSE